MGSDFVNVGEHGGPPGMKDSRVIDFFEHAHYALQHDLGGDPEFPPEITDIRAVNIIAVMPAHLSTLDNAVLYYQCTAEPGPEARMNIMSVASTCGEAKWAHSDTELNVALACDGMGIMCLDLATISPAFFAAVGALDLVVINIIGVDDSDHVDIFGIRFHGTPA